MREREGGKEEERETDGDVGLRNSYSISFTRDFHYKGLAVRKFRGMKLDGELQFGTVSRCKPSVCELEWMYNENVVASGSK